MKKILGMLAIALLVTAGTAAAHHPLEDINEEQFLLIDEMIQDTPHATMVMDDMGGGNGNGSDSADGSMTFVTDDMTTLENMMDDGLLDYVDDMVGDATILIELNGEGNDVTTTISVRE